MDIPVKNNGQNDWVKYRLLVIDTLDRLSTDVSEIANTQIQIRLDVRELKVKAVIWGAASGLLVSTAISILLVYLLPLL